MNLAARYARWLHLQWPAGHVERLPVVAEDGSTGVPGVYVAGDLAGVPLLKFALDTGAKAAARCARELSGQPSPDPDAFDVVIIGAGVAGMAAAVECAKHGLRYQVLESTRSFSTVANFPAGKPIFTYPMAMRPAGALQVTADVKEALEEELRRQADGFGIQPLAATATRIARRGPLLEVALQEGRALRARRVIVAIGRSGNFRRLGVPGEELGKVSNRLHDPKAHTGHDVLVVGGGDSALEAAIALAEAGARVTLSYRGAEFSRPKRENTERLQRLAGAGTIALRLGTTVTAISADGIALAGKGGTERLPNQAVYALIGREAPLDFLRGSGIRIRGEHDARSIAGLIACFGAMTALYAWKRELWSASWANPSRWLAGIEGYAGNERNPLHWALASAHSPSFWVTMLYSAVVVGFGIARIRRRRTPYVRLQTLTLMAIQVLPLFILPEILLPWLNAMGAIPDAVRANLFPDGSWWRAYGFVLAWPLMVWNLFTDQPLWWWLIIGSVQTLVIIPLLVWKWGKGAYCGWICSCGALAETLGDRQREKMGHGPGWNRLNFVGQGLLAIAIVGLLLHIAHWILPRAPLSWPLDALRHLWGLSVDFFLAGALGVGLYFYLSGRVWCRFACPLAALMHIYARFSRFRIIPDEKKCISCNACTTACHQGIDVMSFANRGVAMADPECVRCSACVQVCPTGVLQFGEVDSQGRVLKLDRLAASPVLMREGSSPSTRS
jgi:thioredoxin reductase/ferredoxin